MAHVFISYSKQHRDLTERLAALLEASSFKRPDGRSEPITVWWDQSLVSGDVFHREITREIDQADAVVVIWSAGAAASDWVYAEAQRGAGQRKLVPLRDPALPHDRIPLPFAAFHIDDVSNDAAVLASVCKRLDRIPSEDVAGLPGHQRWLLDPKAEAPLARTARVSPAALLQAKYRIVPFVDFGDRKAKLIAWAGGCDAAGTPIKTAGRVIHGPGGLGKTRLLIEVVRALSDEGWLAGFVNRDTLGHTTRGPQLESLIRTGREARGLFLVVDYAEGRTEDVKALARLLLERERAGGKPARLVLLARAAGDWWSELARSSADVTDVFGIREETLDEMRLGDIAAGEPRVALWTQAAQALKLHLAQDFPAVCALDPAAPPNPELAARLQRVRSEPDYTRPLAIQMEALLWLRGAAPSAHEHGIPTMLDRVVGLERAHWQKVTAGTDAETLDRAVAQVTLVQGVGSRAQAMALLQADSGFFSERAPHQCKNIVGELAKFCAADSLEGEGDHANGGTQSDGLAPLEPDLVGEHHIAEIADKELVDACLRWIADAAAEAAAKRYHLLTVLLRATGGDHGKLAQQALVLLDHLAQQLSTIVPLLNDDEALAAIDAALPMQSLALRTLALHVAQRRVELARGLARAAGDKDVDARDKRGHDAALSRWQRFKHYLARKLRAGADAPAKRDSEQSVAILAHLAARVGTLGNRLSALGRRNDALTATQEAVEIYRRLAQKNPDAFLPDLAMSLNNISVDLASLGRRDDALAATQEAVEIRRRLAQQNPDAFLPDLAGSLNNLGNRLSNLGRRDDALAATQEAVEIYRRLAQKNPDAFLPDLAMSLNNLGMMLSNLGRRDDALAATQEAVDIRRRLAQKNPDAFLPDLAMSLNNLGMMLSNLGRRDDALAATQEAVDIRRRLAPKNPDAFLPDLAMSLNNFGSDLSALGRRDDALAATQEAVDIRRRLAQKNPDAFLPDLAMSLNNFGSDLSALGRRDDALAATQEAVDIRRRLAQKNPDAFLPDLATSLNNLGNRLSDLGRRDDALAATQEAVDIRRRLAEQNPDAFLPALASSLNNLGNGLSALGRRDDALTATQEAVEIRRRLAQQNPDAFLPDLAGSLNNLGMMLSNLGRRDDALTATQEAVEIRRRLAQQNPDAFRPDLAMSLGARGQVLAGLERRGEAAAATAEGLRAIAPFVERHPQAFGKLAGALRRDYVASCEQAGREPDAALLERIARAFGDDA